MNLSNLLRVLQIWQHVRKTHPSARRADASRGVTAASAISVLSLCDGWQMQAFSEAFAVHDACKSRRADRAAVLIAMADICMMTG